MQENTLQKAMDEFIIARINDCESRENPAMQTARAKFYACVDALKQTLTLEQTTLYNHCDTAYCFVSGETIDCYYRAGFADAVSFLLGWRDNAWN